MSYYTIKANLQLKIDMTVQAFDEDDAFDTMLATLTEIGCDNLPDEVESFEIINKNILNYDFASCPIK